MFRLFKVLFCRDIKAFVELSRRYERMCGGLEFPKADKVDLKKLYVSILTIESLKRPTIMLYPEYAAFFIKKLFNKKLRMTLGDAQVMTEKYISRKESVKKGFELLKKYYNYAIKVDDNASETEIVYYTVYCYNSWQHYAWNVLNLYMLLTGREARQNASSEYTETHPLESRQLTKEEIAICAANNYTPADYFEYRLKEAGNEISIEEFRKIFFHVFCVTPQCAKRYDNNIPFPTNWIKSRYFPFG